MEAALPGVYHIFIINFNIEPHSDDIVLCVDTVSGSRLNFNFNFSC